MDSDNIIILNDKIKNCSEKRSLWRLFFGVAGAYEGLLSAEWEYHIMKLSKNSKPVQNNVHWLQRILSAVNDVRAFLTIMRTPWSTDMRVTRHLSLMHQSKVYRLSTDLRERIEGGVMPSRGGTSANWWVPRIRDKKQTLDHYYHK